MKTLYLDIFSGISGDMFLGAMIDLGVNPKELEAALRKLPLEESWHLDIRRATKANIDGVKFDVHGAHCHDHEDHGHGHEHDHAHTHKHEHEHQHGGHSHSHAHAHSHSHEHDHDHDHGQQHPEHDQEHHAHAHEAGGHHDHLAGLTYGPHGGPLALLGKERVEVALSPGKKTRWRLYFYDEHGHDTKPRPGKEVTLEMRRGKKTGKFQFKTQPQFLESTTTVSEPEDSTLRLRLRRGAQVQEAKVHFQTDHDDHSHHGHDHDHSHDHAAHHHHEHGHEHAHGHEHHHHEESRNFSGIKQLIEASTLSAWVKQKAVAVFHRIAVAEGKVHGHPPEEVHFHEVGALDSIVDIVGSCIALELLGRPRVLAAPVVEGTGWVNCAHGRFPVPTMATLAILGARGIALNQCEEPHELVTPTGAALLAEFVEEFGPMRGLVAERIGYGLGTRDNRTRPNVLRAVLGDSAAAGAATSSLDWETDSVAVLETNLDDLSAEILGDFVERALATGALDVFHTPVQMKKNRPGVLLTVLCDASEADRFAEMILRETSAFGVRRTVAERRKLRRQISTVKTEFGLVKVKLGRLNGKVIQAAPEYEACRQLARAAQVPLKKVYEAALRAAKVS